MKEVFWGVLGTANIGKTQVIPAMGKATDCVKYAIAGRTMKKAKEFQKEFGFEVAYDSYDQLLDDPKVEVVYIPLPNHLHKEWVIKAAKKGKHVLCEKPLSGSYQDVEDMIQACNDSGVVFMEAFAYLHSPYIISIKNQVEAGEIGDITLIESHFHTPGYKDDIRIRRDTLGGAVYDLGCYNTSLILHIYGEMPLSAQGCGIFSKEKIDLLATGTMDFGRERYGAFQCGMCSGAIAQSGFTIYGTAGKIESSEMFNSMGELSYTIEKNGMPVEEIVIQTPNNYQLEIEQMQRAMGKGEVIRVSHLFSLQVAEVNDWILESMGYK